MSITINPITIQGSDNVAASRITINTNFELLAESLNTLLEYVDTDNEAISGIKTVSIINGANGNPNPTVTSIETNCSIKVDGNAVIGNTITAKAIELSQGAGITLNAGDLKLLSSTSLADLRGNYKLQGGQVFTSFATTFAAAKKTSYISGGTNYTSIIGEPDNIIGHVSLMNRAGLIIDFSDYDPLNTDLNVNRIKFVVPDGLLAGQMVTVIFVFDDSLGYTFQVEPDNIATTDAIGLSTGIQITNSYASLTLVYSGSAWIIVADNQGTNQGITIA